MFPDSLKLPDFSPSLLPHLWGPFYTLEGLEYLIYPPGADWTWKTYTPQSSKGAYLSILLVDEFQYKDFMRTVWIYSLNLEAPWISNILIQTILQNHLQLKKKKSLLSASRSHFNFFNAFSHLLSLPVSQTSTLRKITGNLYNRCSFPGELFSQTLKELSALVSTL